MTIIKLTITDESTFTVSTEEQGMEGQSPNEQSFQTLDEALGAVQAAAQAASQGAQPMTQEGMMPVEDEETAAMEGAYRGR